MKKSKAIIIFVAILFGIMIPLIQTLVTTAQTWLEIVQAKWGKKAETFINNMESKEVKNPIGFVAAENEEEDDE